MAYCMSGTCCAEGLITTWQVELLSCSLFTFSEVICCRGRLWFGGLVLVGLLRGTSSTRIHSNMMAPRLLFVPANWLKCKNSLFFSVSSVKNFQKIHFVLRKTRLHCASNSFYPFMYPPAHLGSLQPQGWNILTEINLLCNTATQCACILLGTEQAWMTFYCNLRCNTPRVRFHCPPDSLIILQLATFLMWRKDLNSNEWLPLCRTTQSCPLHPIGWVNELLPAGTPSVALSDIAIRLHFNNKKLLMWAEQRGLLDQQINNAL